MDFRHPKNCPFHSAPADDAARPAEVVAAEAEYQLWNSLVQAKDTDSVLALHRAILAGGEGDRLI